MRWLALNWPQVLELAWDHLLLALPSIVASVLIAVPLGRLAHRRPAVGGPLLAVASLVTVFQRMLTVRAQALASKG